MRILIRWQDGSLIRLWKFVLYLHLRLMLCGVNLRVIEQYVEGNPQIKNEKKN
jgi:hypothetical protein